FENSPLRLRANGRYVCCDSLVIGTHVPLMGIRGLAGATLFQNKLALYSSYAIGASLPRGTLPEALYWDTSDPYYYLRIDRRKADDYVVFGGEDHKTGQERDANDCFRRLEEKLRSILP